MSDISNLIFGFCFEGQLFGVFGPGNLRNTFEHADNVSLRDPLKDTCRNLGLCPNQGLRWVMEHRPVSKHAAVYRPADKFIDPGMSVVSADTTIGSVYLFVGALE